MIEESIPPPPGYLVIPEIFGESFSLAKDNDFGDIIMTQLPSREAAYDAGWNDIGLPSHYQVLGHQTIDGEESFVIIPPAGPIGINISKNYRYKGAAIAAAWQLAVINPGSKALIVNNDTIRAIAQVLELADSCAGSGEIIEARRTVQDLLEQIRRHDNL